MKKVKEQEFRGRNDKKQEEKHVAEIEGGKNEIKRERKYIICYTVMESLHK